LSSVSVGSAPAERAPRAGGATTVTRTGRRGLPAAIPAAIGAAWILALAAQATGRAALLHGVIARVPSGGSGASVAHGLQGWLLFVCTWGSHTAHVATSGATAAPGPALWVTLGLFLLAWQVMIAAMMLPSSLPLVRMFAVTSREHERPGLEMAAFLGGYVMVWTAFGVAAFAADVVVHHVVGRTPWLEERPWLIAGSVLVAAGAFQFSSLKERCLKECRHPGAYLLRFYRGGGATGAFRLGRGHGLFCMGCCWALMLVGFAAGVASLWWMVAITALMYFEKVRRGGARSLSISGVALVGLGLVVLAHPGWLPAAFRGA
jgi:predicted metal-binding membrane protein